MNTDQIVYVTFAIGVVSGLLGLLLRYLMIKKFLKPDPFIEERVEPGLMVIGLLACIVSMGVFWLDRSGAPTVASSATQPRTDKPAPTASPATQPKTDKPAPTDSLATQSKTDKPAPTAVASSQGTKEVVVHLGGGVKLKMVRVPKGTAYLGGTGGKAGTKQVEVAEFYMGVYEVTQAQWKAVMGADNNPSKFKGDDLPVESVSWNDVKKFIAKMKGGGYLYRLPSEVEWEYACRGGPISEVESQFDFYFDKPTNDLSSDDANFNGKYPAGETAASRYLEKTVKVGSYKPNKLGLYDMHGNVWEWCEDLDAKDGSVRVFRGGGWGVSGRICTAAERGWNAPGAPSIGLGFRLAASPSP